jgi:hypothetical protein
VHEISVVRETEIYQEPKRTEEEWNTVYREILNKLITDSSRGTILADKIPKITSLGFDTLSNLTTSTPRLENENLLQSLNELNIPAAQRLSKSH